MVRGAVRGCGASWLGVTVASDGSM